MQRKRFFLIFAQNKPLNINIRRAASILYDLFETYKSRGSAVFISHLRPDPRLTFERANIVKLLGEESFFEDVASAIAQVERVEMAPEPAPWGV